MFYAFVYICGGGGVGEWFSETMPELDLHKYELFGFVHRGKLGLIVNMLCENGGYVRYAGALGHYRNLVGSLLRVSEDILTSAR